MPADVYQHPDYLALLRGVRERPADDLPRLVIADWLDEHGEGDRAEFIRVQCELARRGEGWSEARKEVRRRVLLREISDTAAAILLATAETHPDALQGREQELLAVNAAKWSPPGFLAVTSPDYFGRPDEHRILVYRRGFVESVHGPLAAWLEHGPAVVASHPVEGVTATDREPWPTGDVRPDQQYGWRLTRGEHLADPNFIPVVVGNCLPGGRGPLRNRYPTREAALAALSDALLAWALARPAP
jgi:uncharacterized protein (TIGR02996 family)